MPDYTPYHIQKGFRPQHQQAEDAEVEQLQLLQQLASTPGLQEKLAQMFGMSAGLGSMKQGGQDGAWNAAIAHETMLNPNRNSAFQALHPQDSSLTDMYNRVGNPEQRAAMQRQQLSDVVYQMFGQPNLPKHPGISYLQH